jgi:hypothetical protein
LILHTPNSFIIIHQYSQHGTWCIRENEPKCNINILCTCFRHAVLSVGRTCWHAVNIWHWTLYLNSLQYGAVKHHTFHYSVASFGTFMDSRRLLCLAELEGSLVSMAPLAHEVDLVTLSFFANLLKFLCICCLLQSLSVRRMSHWLWNAVPPSLHSVLFLVICLDFYWWNQSNIIIWWKQTSRFVAMCQFLGVPWNSSGTLLRGVLGA